MCGPSASRTTTVEKVIVIEVGVEGGGATVFGEDNGGVWSFWQEGSSLSLDEDDHEIGSDWRTQPVGDLERALPGGWVRMFPMKIHPTFLPWVRTRYEAERAELPEYQRRVHDEHVHPAWCRFFQRFDTPTP